MTEEDVWGIKPSTLWEGSADQTLNMCEQQCKCKLHHVLLSPAAGTGNVASDPFCFQGLAPLPI